MAAVNSLRSLLAASKKENIDILKRGNAFTAKLDAILEEPGFNARDYDRQEVQDHIRELAEAYKAGDVLPPLTVVVRDGVIYVREGHCRLRAAKLARAEGAPIEALAVTEMQGDEIDQAALVLTSNSQLKLTALERARQYARLKGFNLSDAEIAKRVHRTVPHVIQYLAMNNMPVKLKELVNDGVLSPTLALEAYQENGEKAVEIIQSHIQGAEPDVAKNIEVAAGVETGAEKAKEQTDEQTAESEKPAKKVKAPRITRQALDAQSGFRSKITGKLAKRVTDGINSLASRIPPVTEDASGEVVLKLTAEEARDFLELQKSILPKGLNAASAEVAAAAEA